MAPAARHRPAAWRPAAYQAHPRSRPQGFRQPWRAGRPDPRELRTSPRPATRSTRADMMPSSTSGSGKAAPSPSTPCQTATVRESSPWPAGIPKANGQARPRYYCQHWEPGRWPVWGHLPRGGMPTPESPRTVVGLIADHLAQLNLRAVVTGRREPELEYLSASPTGSAATGFTRYANSPGNIYSSILACGSPTPLRGGTGSTPTALAW